MKRFYLLPQKINGLNTGVISDNGKLSAAQFLTPGHARQLQRFRNEELKLLERLRRELRYASDLA